MRIVVTGANGQLGTVFERLVPDATFLGREDLDLSQAPGVIGAQVQRLRPDLLINCAAFTDADAAEENEPSALHVNAMAVAALAAGCASVGSRMVTYSSDYVFGGEVVPGGYSEDRPAWPRSAYGRSKLWGERMVQDLPHVMTIRTGWVFGAGDNFVATMLKLAARGLTSVDVVGDQVGRPTYSPDLARISLELAALATPPRLIQVANGGEPASWADLAETTFRLADEAVHVRRVTTAQYFHGRTGVAPRPRYSAFCLDRLNKLGIEPRSWQSALAEYLGCR